MAQVAFDTLKFVDTLEKAGLPREHARAISFAVKESHESVDVATRTDILLLQKDADARNTQTQNEFTKVRSEIAALREETQHEFAKVRDEIAALRTETQHEFAKVRDEINKLSLQLTVRLGGMLIVGIGALAAIIKL